MARLILSGFADEASPCLDGQIDALTDNKVAYVELRQVDGINVADFTPEKTATIAQKLKGHQIHVSCLGSPIGKIKLTDSFPEHLEKMKQLCDTAHRLETSLIRIFSFYLPEQQTPEQCREEVIERVGRLLDIADAQSCTLLHENERDIFGDVPERCLQLHRAFESRLRGILDPANYLLVDADPLQAMVELDEWIDYLHIKDVRLSDKRIVPAGKGDGRLPEIINLMKKKEGSRFLSVEPHLTHFAGREALEKDSSNTPEQLADEYTYADGPSAFKAAVQACRSLL